MIKVVFSLAAIVIGLALIINNFVRVAPEGEKDSVGIVEYNIEQDSKIRNTEPYIQMGKELINLTMPDGFVDYRDSKIKSLEQLYELYERSSSLDSSMTLVSIGINNDAVDFIRTNKGAKPKGTKLTMLYENDSKSAFFTPEILYKMEDAYKNEVYVLPKTLDEKVARLHLEKIGANLTELSKEQADYINVPVDGPYKPNHYRY